MSFSSYVLFSHVCIWVSLNAPVWVAMVWSSVVSDVVSGGIRWYPVVSGGIRWYPVVSGWYPGGIRVVSGWYPGIRWWYPGGIRVVSGGIRWYPPAPARGLEAPCFLYAATVFFLFFSFPLLFICALCIYTPSLLFVLVFASCSHCRLASNF